MSTSATLSASELAGGNILARLERMPMGAWQVRARLIIGTATFFDAFDVLAVASVVPVLAQEWGLSTIQIGNLLAAAFAGQLIGVFFFGWIAEKIGRMPALSLSVLIFGAMSLASAFAWNYNTLLIFRFLEGIGLGGEVPIAATYISEISRAHRRGRWFVIYEMAFSLGLAATGVVASRLIPAFGWRAMFVVGALPALAVFALRMILPESPRWLVQKNKLAEADKVVTDIENFYRNRGVDLQPVAISSGLQPISNKSSGGARLSELVKSTFRRRTISVWALWFCAYFTYYGLATWLPTIYRSVFKLELSTALLLGSASMVCGWIGILMCAAFIDSVGRRIWFTAAFACSCLTFFSLWTIGASTAAALFVFIAINAIFLNSTNVALYLYTTEIYPTRMRALGTSIASGWARIASFSGPVLVGFVMNAFGLPTVFAMFALLTLLGAVNAFSFMLETNERRLEEISG